MKIIHTSDWHLGQNLFGFDRKAEHESMIRQLVDLVSAEKPDALIIAGDVYDSPTPNTGVQKEFADYMVRLYTACPQMMIVCISGNHDSASRHEIFQTPWEALGVKMVGRAERQDFSDNIIQVPGKGWIVAVPYTHDRYLSDEFYSELQEKTREIAGEELPIIYVGHAAIRDTDYTGHQKQGDRFIGGIDCTGIEEIGSLYDYVALGHIHKAQTFDGGRARYCGSPIAMSFDEVREGYDHGFDVVEIYAHGSVPKIRAVPVDNPIPLVNIPEEGHSEWADAVRLLAELPSDVPALVRLNILLKGNDLLPIDKDSQVQMALKGKKALLAVINSTRETFEPEDDGTLGALTIQELQEMDHKTILTEFAKSAKFEFTKEFDEMFDIVYKIVTDPDYENK